MYSKHRKGKLMGLIVACSALSISSTANAIIASPSDGMGAISAYSEGYAAYVDLNLLDLADIVLAPIPGDAHGQAPGPYNVTDETAKLVIPDILTLDVLWGEASSDVDGVTDGDRHTRGFGEVAGLSLNLLGLVTLDLGAINATASVNGDFGSMTASADTTVLEATGTILGIPVDVDVSPSAEINLLGISIIFDERVENCSTDDFCSIEANAIHINFDNLVLNGVTAGLLGVETLTGDVIVAHAYAEMKGGALAPIPVPAAVWLFGTGIMGLVGFARRKTQIAA